MKKITFILLAAFLLMNVPFYSVQAQTSVFGKLVSLTGGVFDATTKSPAKVNMEAFDKDGKKIYRGTSNPAQNGYYFITGLNPGSSCVVRIVDLAYLKQDYEVPLPNTDKYAEFSKDYLVYPKQKGLEIKVPITPFELNKSKLRVGAEVLLNDLLELMRQNPRVRFTVVAFPDNAKDPVENKKLTDERSKALRDFFVNNGIQPERVQNHGNDAIDPKHPMPEKKAAKGKRYLGPCYIILDSF